MITKHFGSVAASNVKSLEIERLPMIALIYRLRGTTEIFQVIMFNAKLLGYLIFKYFIKY